MADKHLFKEETNETSLELGPLKFRKTRWLNIAALATLATASAAALRPYTIVKSPRGTLDLNASAEQLPFEFREVTGEDIVDMTLKSGGVIDWANVTYDDHGLITSIEASIPTYYEYDAAEMSEVLDSLHATVTPKKLTGDLAQTSVTTTGGEVQVLALSEWTLSWKRKTVEATTTDDAAYESSVASTKSWSVKAKYMFFDGDTTQASYLYAAISTLQNDAATWNFFPTVEQGRTVFQGAAIIDGIDISTGMGKVVGSDISLKGTGQLLILTQSAPVANSATVTGTQGEV